MEVQNVATSTDSEGSNKDSNLACLTTTCTQGQVLKLAAFSSIKIKDKNDFVLTGTIHIHQTPIIQLYDKLICN